MSSYLQLLVIGQHSVLNQIVFCKYSALSCNFLYYQIVCGRNNLSVNCILCDCELYNSIVVLASTVIVCFPEFNCLRLSNLIFA